LEAKEAARGGGGYGRARSSDGEGAFAGAATQAVGQPVGHAVGSGANTPGAGRGSSGGSGGELPALGRGGGGGAGSPNGGHDEAAAAGAAAGAGSAGAADRNGSSAGGAGEPCVVLTAATAGPEFLQLPLEYQGFCPWTVAHQHGFLLPGKPVEGVVRCVHEVKERKYSEREREVSLRG